MCKRAKPVYMMVLNEDELKYIYISRTFGTKHRIPFKELSETLNFTECYGTMAGTLCIHIYRGIGEIRQSIWLVLCLVKGLKATIHIPVMVPHILN